MSENNYQKQLDDSNNSIKRIQERKEFLKANSKALKDAGEQYQKAQSATAAKIRNRKMKNEQQ
jgi:hypothetical protein